MRPRVLSRPIGADCDRNLLTRPQLGNLSPSGGAGTSNGLTMPERSVN